MISRQRWGSAGGEPVELFTLSSGAGMTVAVTTFGATVQSIRVPDRDGRSVNVALGFATLEEYEANTGGPGATYFGAVIGRCANRIAGRSFVLDGKRYDLAGDPGGAAGGAGDVAGSAVEVAGGAGGVAGGAGDVAGGAGEVAGAAGGVAGGAGSGVSLHGGPGFYHRRVWRAEATSVDAAAALRLSYTDPDGSAGFPGTVSNEVVYAVTEDNALRIEYRISTDAPTVVNLTNHTYFNLAGEGSGDVYDQLLAINASEVQFVDQAQIPLRFASVSGTPFDFRAMKPIGRDLGAVRSSGGRDLGAVRSSGGRDPGQVRSSGGRDLGAVRSSGGQDAGAARSPGASEQLAIAQGYDHNWVLAGAGYRLAAVAFDPPSGIVLWAYTDQPGVQFYTGNHLTGDLVGPSGRPYRPGGGFALETQHYPDTPNHIGEPRWPSVVLRPGEVLRTRTTYRFGVAGPELAERVRF